MVYRKAVFVVVYCREKNEIKYLILKRQLHWIGWEFPKGGLGVNENIEETIRREVFEETGLKILNIKKFNERGQYDYDKEYLDRPGIKGQNYVLYAAEVEKDRVLVDNEEHSKFKWVNFKKAMKKLTWDNQKKCLNLVDSWLKNAT